MKTCYFIILAFFTISSFAQSASQYDNIPLTNDKEYRRAEPQVILAIDYVYTTPFEKDNLHRKNAISFIMKWMSGTPDFSFIPDKTVTKVTSNDHDLAGLYFVCLAKYALEKGKGVDREELKYNSYLLLANYCENPENSYPIKGEIKKLIEAKNQGKLQEYIDKKK